MKNPHSSWSQKIKALLPKLMASLLIINLITFLLSKTNLSLGLDQARLGRFSFYLVLLVVITNCAQFVGGLRKFFPDPKKNKRFLLLTGANLALIGLFLVLYAISQYGSPLVYENHPQGFKAVKEIPLVENTIISQEFTADSNNLGTVGIKLSVQEKTLGFDEEGEIVAIKPEKEIEKIEEISQEAQEEPLEEITDYEPAEIIFRLKEKGAEEWFYENTYYFDEPTPTHLYPFGFPPIENSKDKTYLVEIESQKPIASEENNLYLFASVNKDNQPYLYSRYVYNRGELKENIRPILENTLRKISLTFKNEETILIIIIHLILSFVLIASSFKKQSFNAVLQYSFLIFLFFLSVHQFLPKFFPDYHWENSILKPYLAITTTILGLILVFKNKKEIERSILGEEAKETEEERRRTSEFPKKFPFLAKIPVLGNIFSWAYSQGLWPILGLFIILTIFTVVKAPYFGVSFTGEHSTKYMAHVDPARNMHEQNNPFWMQRKYRVDPVNNPQGINKTFGSPPLNEWGLFLTYKLFPSNSIEFNTRIFTHFLGITILVLVFVFFSKWFSKKLALLITFLISINPIINFSSFVTIEDSWLIIFTFLSLIYLTRYLKKRNTADLVWTGIFFGIGIACKYSIFLWLMPIIFLLLLFHNKKANRFIKDFVTILFFSLAIFLADRNSLRWLPTNAPLSFLKFFLCIILFSIFYLLLIKFDNQITRAIDFILKKRLLTVLTVSLFLITGGTFLYFTGLYKMSDQFLTDARLIFNWKLYDHMLNKQFKPYMTENIYFLGLIGFISILFLKIKKQKGVLLSFLLGSFIYWISASKSMFFHNYYTNVIMITFSLTSGTIVYFVLKGDKGKNASLGAASFLFFMIFLFLPAYQSNIQRLDKEVPLGEINELTQFLKNNMGKDDIYIDEKWDYRYITLITGIPQTNIAQLKQPEIKESIEKIGFANTMKKYKIVYLITEKEYPLYREYLELFTDASSINNSTNSTRTDLILADLNPQESEEISPTEENNLINEYKIPEKFVLEKEFGHYKVFSFAN